MQLLGILVGTSLVVWLAVGVFTFWNTAGRTVLETGKALQSHERLPKVSILVPARNEEDALHAALESFLSLDYPDFDIIVVDDDSTDRTGEIAEEFARRSDAAGRLRIIHKKELPAGWTGKVHALHSASLLADGEWFLATDADVVFHPQLLRLAMECALGRDARLLSLVPQMELGSFWEKVVLPPFVLLLSTLFPLRAINNPKCPRAIAAGAFILMRASDLRELGGYERIRSAVIEDVRTADLFKRNGRRIYLAVTRGLFRTRMYRDVRELWDGLSRSAFEGAGFSVGKVLAAVLATTLFGLLPWLSFPSLLLRDAMIRRFPLSDPVLLVSLAACGMACAVYLPIVIFFRVRASYVFTLPLGIAFYSLVSLNSMLLGGWSEGVGWKGRRYRKPAN